MKKITEIPKKEGIYCIQNLINNKIYIGSSNNLHRRYYQHRHGDISKLMEHNKILYNAYKKYKPENFSFQVIKLTKEYLVWEEIFIRLLKPEYNIATITNGKNQPNIGKKFSKEWIAKLGKCEKHSEETKIKLTSINKENACKLIFEKEDIILNFNSWKEALIHFNLSSPVSLINAKDNWRGWIIKKLNHQKKKVKLNMDSKIYKFNSASECDKFLKLWRGATSNAIKNNQGFFYNCFVEYL